MAKKKKGNMGKDLLKSFLAGTTMAFGIGYVGLSLHDFLTNGIEITQALLNFSSKIEWFSAQEDTTKFGIYASPLVMTLLFKAFNRKASQTYSDASEHGVFGNATFSDIEDLKEEGFVPKDKNSMTKTTKWSSDFRKTLKIPEGIILGRQDDELVVLHPNSKLDNRNVLVIGSSGSAKGQSFVIPNLINNYSSSMVVTDPKGELYNLLKDIKKDQGYAVHQVDFLNLKGSRYNPLDYISTDLEAKKIADSISRNSSKDGKEDFFFNTARDLLIGLILLAKSQKADANMKDVKRLFNKVADSETGPEFLFEVLEKIGEEHVAYQFLADANAQSGNTRASIMSSFAQQTGVFTMRQVASFTEASDFRFEDMQKEKTIIFVKIPVNDNPVEALTATFFDQMFSTLYKIGDENGSILPIPTICLLDEFANLGKLNNYDNILSTCRGYRLSLMTIVQDFAQLENRYKPEVSRTIVNNHDTSLFLRTKDQKTAEYFEKSAGDTTVLYNTQSKQGGGNWAYYFGLDKQPKQNSPSESQNFTKKPLVDQTTLMNMQKLGEGDECFVYMGGRVLQLRKALQSVIYKDFITASKPEGHVYLYNYPKHRREYMKILGFEYEITEEDKEENEVDGYNEIKPSGREIATVNLEGLSENAQVATASPVVETDNSVASSQEETTELNTVSETHENASEQPIEQPTNIDTENSTEEDKKASEASDDVVSQQGLVYSIAEMVSEEDFTSTKEGLDELRSAFDFLNKEAVTVVRETQEAFDLASEGEDTLDELTSQMGAMGSLFNNDVSNSSEEKNQDEEPSKDDDDFPM